jgi:hypothetical protein
VAGGELDARRDAQDPGPLEGVAGAALEGDPGLAQRGPGSLELVREPQRVGEAPQGARLEVVRQAGRGRRRRRGLPCAQTPSCALAAELFQMS